MAETVFRLDDFSLRLIRDFLDTELLNACQRHLQTQLPWRQEKIRLFGRQVPIPRQQCWIGDSRARYRYSGLELNPLPWPVWLAPVRQLVEKRCGRDFNSVLCNRYRTGSDSMGWHSDDEPELGPAPVIASLTLGADRRFQFRRRHDRADRLTLVLPHNSLLIMPAGLQSRWQHQLPKTRQPVAERINLTFRYVFAAPPA